MRIKKQFILITLVSLIFMFFTGCAKSPFHDSEEAIDKNKNEIQRIHDIENAPIAPVVTKSGFYADTKKIDLAANPAWLKQNISVTSQRLPFSFVMSHILRNTEVLVKYNPRVSKERPVDLDYNGNIKGALDQLSSQTNYAYDINCNELTWSAFVTKTFNISFMPGSATYVVGQTSSSSAKGVGSSSSSSSSGTGTGGNVTSVSGSFMTSDQQYSGLQASSLSVWNDLKKTLDELKSPDGKVSVSESTTMVTVYDRPSNVEAIGRYIAQLNRSMSQEVKIKVQVLELNLDSAHAYGVDWNLVQHWLGTQMAVNSNAGSTSNVANSVGGQSTSSFLTPATFRIGYAGNDVLLNALSAQGKLSVVTEPTVVTMNNQVAEIRINRDTSYLQSSSTSTLVNGPTTTSLNPGIVTDGFILYLLPKIKDDKIYLQVSSTLSSLDALTTIYSNGVGPTGNTTTDSNLQTIQVPTLSEKKFNIRSIVPNDYTLVIGGFKQSKDALRSSKMFGMQALGGKGSDSKNTETILLITPTVVEE